MNLIDITPHIRFAQQVVFNTSTSELIGLDNRIFYVLSGKLDITIKKSTYSVCEGELFFCHSGIPYKTVASQKNIIYSLNFDFSQERSDIVIPIFPVLAPKGKLKLIDSSYIDDYKELNTFFKVKDIFDIRNDIKNIIKEFEQQRPLFREYSGTILNNILLKCLRAKSSIVESSDKLFLETLKYIKENYNNDLTNKLISEKMGYHEYHINRIFKKHMHTTLYQYIIQLRISEAKKLLLNTELSVLNICYNVGYGDLSHFISQFKKATGYTPFTYRKTFKNII